MESRRLFAAIMGTVFLDGNGDGARQDGEPGLSGWRVYIDGNTNNAFDEGERSALTNGDGFYIMEELAAGTHRVREVVKEGFTRTSPGGNGTHEVTLANGDSRVEGIAFGNRANEDAESASIRGVVYDDRNGNGAREDGEPALSGWTVYLDQNNNGSRDEGERAATTNGTGNYAFEELAAGTYRVREVLPDGWTITRPGDGFYVVQLEAGQAANERVFANHRSEEEPPPPPPAGEESASIRGLVFNDVNGDGTRQDGEPALAGWRVYLDQNQNAQHDDGERSALTNGAGNYAFEELAAGNYRVREVLPAGWTIVRPESGFHAVTLVNGQAANDGVFANRRNEEEPPPAPPGTEPASIRGFVFDDLNGDGARQDGEPPLAGWTLYLDQNNNNQHDDAERGVATNEAGGYAFEELAAGTYRVREILPVGWTIVRPGEGFYLVNVTAGESANERIFANRRTAEAPAESASIRGAVFDDRNASGARDDGEPALGGWLIYLDQNSNGQRDDGERATETNFDGRYAFEGLAAGTYFVREALPEGWTVIRPGEGFHVVELANGQRGDGRDFANFRGEDGPGAPTDTGAIVGEVFDDLDLDGTRDAGEPGVRGARVFLDANGNDRRDRRERRGVSDVSGVYVIADVPAGQHVVKHVRPRGYRPTALSETADEATVNVAEFGSAGVSLALTRKSLLQGVIFQDTNRNRTADPGETAAAGLTVFLDLNRNNVLDATEPTTLTDAAGRYTFVVDRGSYRIGEVQPAAGIVTSKVKVGAGKVVSRDVALR